MSADTDALVPVAWMSKDGKRIAFRRHRDYCTPLYGVDTIERLTRERDEARQVCAEAYQVVGVLLDETGQFETEHGTKILDNLSEHRPIHDDVLPWENSNAIEQAVARERERWESALTIAAGMAEEHKHRADDVGRLAHAVMSAIRATKAPT